MRKTGVKNNNCNNNLNNDSNNKENNLYASLFSSFFRIGLFTFGGGYAMIPLIHREVAENRKWVSETEVVDILALAQSIPGVIAINSASIIGFKMKGRLGAIVATAGVILPSFVIITLIAAFFSRFRNVPVIQSIFRGIRPAITALIAAAVFKVAGSSVRDILTAIIAAAALIISLVFDIHAIFIILGGALTGMILRRTIPGRMYIFKDGRKDGVE